MNILINKLTNSMAEVVEEMGVEGKKLPDNSNCEIQSIDGDMIDAFKQGHCRFENGAIVLIPEEEWAENIIDEVTE